MYIMMLSLFRFLLGEGKTTVKEEAVIEATRNPLRLISLINAYVRQRKSHVYYCFLISLLSLSLSHGTRAFICINLWNCVCASV